MSRLLRWFLLISAALISAGWLVRLGMQSIIPLPVSDFMVEAVLHFYPAQDQEETANMLGVLGILVWMPVTAAFWWGLLRFGMHRRGLWRN